MVAIAGLKLTGGKLLNDQQRNHRKGFVRDLRENPYQFVQNHSGRLIDENGARCALGLGCATFGIWLDPAEEEPQEAYDSLAAYLGVWNSSATESEITDQWLENIWTLNDIRNKTFAEIAEFLESKGFLNE